MQPQGSPQISILLPNRCSLNGSGFYCWSTSGWSNHIYRMSGNLLKNDTVRTTATSFRLIDFVYIFGTRKRGSNSTLLLYCLSEGEIIFTNSITLKRTLLLLCSGFLISWMRLLKASSTLCRTFADVSISLQPRCLARSSPSWKTYHWPVKVTVWESLNVPFTPTCRSYSKSHLFATIIVGTSSW